MQSLVGFGRRRRSGALMLLVVSALLVSCGGAPVSDVPSAPATSASAAVSSQPSASAAPAASSQPSASATASIAASAAPSASPSASTVAEASPTLVPTEPVDGPTENFIEAAIVRPDLSVVYWNGAADEPLGQLAYESISVSLAWSPDGHRLAMEGGVYTFGDAGTPPALAPVAGSGFRWSRDGSQLAWVAGVEEHLDVIRVGKPDGDEPRVVGGSHWAYTGAVAWSPGDDIVLAGALEANVDGSGYRIVDGRGKNPDWSPTDDAIAYTKADVVNGTGTITVTVADRGAAPRSIGTITLPMPGAEGVPPELEFPRLRWLPDGSGVMLSLPPGPLLSDAGTYLVRGGTATLVSPHVMTDLSPDGTRMLARTMDSKIVVVNLADGAITSDLGLGITAAWRPAHTGAPPASPLAEKSPTLRLATPLATGDAVRELQQRLTDQGFSVGAVDGVFGPQTDAAVRAFQTAHSLDVDGVVGPRTWALLRFDAEAAIRENGAIPQQ